MYQNPAQLIDQKYCLWINGREMHPTENEWFDVVNPSDGEMLSQAARARVPDVDKAVESAKTALPKWTQIPNSERGRILRRIADLLRDDVDKLATIETLDCGKPLSQAKTDVLKSAEAFDFYSGITDKIFGKTIPISQQFLDYTLLEPIGVTAHISPWNYPLRLAIRSVAPALAAGNTVILKPAEETPLTAIHFARLTAEAGLPDGVFNVVTGFGEEAGTELASHPGINHISFTGAVETGIKVMQMAAQNVVPVTLELGGKSPNIVFADADLHLAMQGTLKAIFTNAGQVCCAGSRLLLETTIYHEFVEELRQRVKGMRLGPGIQDPDMGPLISAKQQHRVSDYVRRGIEEGAEKLIGGDIPNDDACRRGFFFQPTLMGNVDNRMRIAQDEIFGPILTIIKFRDEDEAARIANDSQYGLVAGIWTSNLDRAHKMASQIQAGQIYINDFFSGSAASPFGGYKKSGFGRERGMEALRHYTQVKNVCIKFKGSSEN